MLVGNTVLPGVVDASEYDLYSLLKTFEDGFGLNNLGQRDASALPIANIWR